MSYMHSVVRYFQFSLVAVMLATFCTVALAEKVDLNKANAEALQYIPGIGPGKSKRIIELRESSGGFKTMDELLSVPGIGEKVMEEIRKYGAIDAGVPSLTEEMKQNPPRKNVTSTAQENDAQSG